MGAVSSCCACSLEKKPPQQIPGRGQPDIDDPRPVDPTKVKSRVAALQPAPPIQKLQLPNQKKNAGTKVTLKETASRDDDSRSTATTEDDPDLEEAKHAVQTLLNKQKPPAIVPPVLPSNGAIALRTTRSGLTTRLAFLTRRQTGGYYTQRTTRNHAVTARTARTARTVRTPATSRRTYRDLQKAPSMKRQPSMKRLPSNGSPLKASTSSILKKPEHVVDPVGRPHQWKRLVSLQLEENLSKGPKQSLRHGFSKAMFHNDMKSLEYIKQKSLIQEACAEEDEEDEEDEDDDYDDESCSLLPDNLSHCTPTARTSISTPSEQSPASPEKADTTSTLLKAPCVADSTPGDIISRTDTQCSEVGELPSMVRTTTRASARMTEDEFTNRMARLSRRGTFVECEILDCPAQMRKGTGFMCSTNPDEQTLQSKRRFSSIVEQLATRAPLRTQNNKFIATK